MILFLENLIRKLEKWSFFLEIVLQMEKWSLFWKRNVRVLNPGSCGPRNLSLLSTWNVGNTALRAIDNDGVQFLSSIIEPIGCLLTKLRFLEITLYNRADLNMFKCYPQTQK